MISATRKLPLACCPLLLEFPVSVHWQAIVCRIDACRVSRNFYTWTFEQAIPRKRMLQAPSRRNKCPEYPARSSLSRRFCGIHHVRLHQWGLFVHRTSCPAPTGCGTRHTARNGWSSWVLASLPWSWPDRGRARLRPCLWCFFCMSVLGWDHWPACSRPSALVCDLFGRMHWRPTRSSREDGLAQSSTCMPR